MNQVHGIKLGGSPEGMMHHPRRLCCMTVVIMSNYLPELDPKHFWENKQENTKSKLIFSIFQSEVR